MDWINPAQYMEGWPAIALLFVPDRNFVVMRATRSFGLSTWLS